MNQSIIIFIIIVIIAILLCTINHEDFNFYYDDAKYYTYSYFNKDFLINNNMLDKPSDKKNKIAIVSFENRKDIEFINLHNQNVLEYCKKWNYEYLFYDKCIHNIYWCKMYFILDALKTGKYDYVMWLDSDTIIKNPNISLDTIVNKYSSDIFVNVDEGASAFCAGVFIIKNSKIGIEYIENCIKLNNNKCLKKESIKLKGLWAGLCYEQGAMNQLIFEKYYPYTTCLPKYYIFNGYIDDTLEMCNSDGFILHLYASPNELRAKCFSRFV